MIKLIAVRHGETVENAKKFVSGQIPGKLNAKGRAQARDAAKRIARMRIDAIYSSDLARAADTARIIAKGHPHLKIIFVKALREKHMGDLQGKPRPQADYLGLVGRSGETLPQFRRRVKRFLDGLAKTRDGKTVLLVTHGGTIRTIRAVVNGKPVTQIVGGRRIKNTQIMTFRYR